LNQEVLREGGREFGLGGLLSTAVQPVKVTNDSRTGSMVEGIWDMELGGRRGGFVDGIPFGDVVEGRFGDWVMGNNLCLRLCLLDVRREDDEDVTETVNSDTHESLDG
jgi:hypothetical protein